MAQINSVNTLILTYDMLMYLLNTLSIQDRGGLPPTEGYLAVPVVLVIKSASHLHAYCN